MTEAQLLDHEERHLALTKKFYMSISRTLGKNSATALMAKESVETSTKKIKSLKSLIMGAK